MTSRVKDTRIPAANGRSKDQEKDQIWRGTKVLQKGDPAGSRFENDTRSNLSTGSFDRFVITCYLSFSFFGSVFVAPMSDRLRENEIVVLVSYCSLVETEFQGFKYSPRAFVCRQQIRKRIGSTLEHAFVFFFFLNIFFKYFFRFVDLANVETRLQDI